MRSSTPSIYDDDFKEAVRVAQAEFDQHAPDIVGVLHGVVPWP